MAKKRERQQNKGAQNESNGVHDLSASRLSLEDFIRAALQTGQMPADDSPPAPKKKAAKRRPKSRKHGGG